VSIVLDALDTCKDAQKARTGLSVSFNQLGLHISQSMVNATPMGIFGPPFPAMHHYARTALEAETYPPRTSAQPACKLGLTRHILQRVPNQPLLCAQGLLGSLLPPEYTYKASLLAVQQRPPSQHNQPAGEQTGAAVEGKQRATKAMRATRHRGTSSCPDGGEGAEGGFVRRSRGGLPAAATSRPLGSQSSAACSEDFGMTMQPESSTAAAHTAEAAPADSSQDCGVHASTAVTAKRERDTSPQPVRIDWQRKRKRSRCTFARGTMLRADPSCIHLPLPGHYPGAMLLQ
jgi:hypothetical protein